VDLSTFIISVFCLIDDRLKDLGRLRGRGPAPTLWDSEVLTIEVVGEFLGIDEDTELFAYFRRHYAHFFPSLRRVHRTTFTRQAANLWKAKELLWQELLTCAPHDSTFAICDSMPQLRYGVSVRPSPSLQALQRGGCFRQGHPPQADLLRL
jgi:hypothetical protein